MEQDFLTQLKSTLTLMFAQTREQFAENKDSMGTVLFIFVSIVVVVVLYVAARIIQSVMITKRANDKRKMYEEVLTNVQYSRHPNKPSSDSTILNRPVLKVLADECRSLGEKIDRHTRRKDHSKNVSELVFRVALELDVSRTTAAVYFCAAMVYDAGLLDSPGEIFFMDVLKKREKQMLKTHVQRTVSYLEFVPKEYYDTFLAAALYHHENEDGSGYPEELTSESIPLVAKILHVVESYDFLVSKRRGRRVYSRDRAILELRRLRNIYDQNVVDALEKVLS